MCTTDVESVDLFSDILRSTRVQVHLDWWGLQGFLFVERMFVTQSLISTGEPGLLCVCLQEAMMEDMSVL